MFIDTLDMDETIAQLLVTEGFTSIEEMAFVEIEKLASIQDFDEELATELHTHTNEYLVKRDEEYDVERRTLEVEDTVTEIKNLTPTMLIKLDHKGVRTLDDLDDLASDELTEILNDIKMDEEATNRIIMAARAH